MAHLSVCLVAVLFRPEINIDLRDRLMPQCLLSHACHRRRHTVIKLLIDTHMEVFHMFHLFRVHDRAAVAEKVDHAGFFSHQADDLQDGLLRNPAAEDTFFLVKIIDDRTACADPVTDLGQRLCIRSQFGNIPSRTIDHMYALRGSIGNIPRRIRMNGLIRHQKCPIHIQGDQTDFSLFHLYSHSGVSRTSI